MLANNVEINNDKCITSGNFIVSKIGDDVVEITNVRYTMFQKLYVIRSLFTNVKQIHQDDKVRATLTLMPNSKEKFICVRTSVTVSKGDEDVVQITPAHSSVNGVDSVSNRELQQVLFDKSPNGQIDIGKRMQLYRKSGQKTVFLLKSDNEKMNDKNVLKSPTTTNFSKATDVQENACITSSNFIVKSVAGNAVEFTSSKFTKFFNNFIVLKGKNHLNNVEEIHVGDHIRATLSLKPNNKTNFFCIRSSVAGTKEDPQMTNAHSSVNSMDHVKEDLLHNLLFAKCLPQFKEHQLIGQRVQLFNKQQHKCDFVLQTSKSISPSTAASTLSLSSSATTSVESGKIETAPIITSATPADLETSTKCVLKSQPSSIDIKKKDMLMPTNLQLVDPLQELAGRLCGHAELLERIKTAVSTSPKVLSAMTLKDPDLVINILNL